MYTYIHILHVNMIKMMHAGNVSNIFTHIHIITSTHTYIHVTKNVHAGNVSNNSRGVGE